MKKYDLTINGKTYNVEIKNFDGKKASVDVNGKNYSVDVAFKGGEPVVNVAKPAPKPAAAAPAQASSAPASAPVGNVVKAPMPGLILKVLVNVGDTVKIGQKVMVMEAMKMENDLNASASGTIKEIKVKEGDTVKEGDILLVLG